ncbi:hypothetical protein QZH41_002959 [Actinostola sp. cb2023]|nr:hypothetical protein QZH41_002959 [Actinostola sp. cb2023]
MKFAKISGIPRASDKPNDERALDLLKSASTRSLNSVQIRNYIVPMFTMSLKDYGSTKKILKMYGYQLAI